MKKFLMCILALVLFTGAAGAQRGLNCYPVFRGDIIPKKQMVVTEARGASMATYKLSYYRSVRFQADARTASQVAALVDADALAATSAETETTGELLTYALIQLKPSGKTRRYLCYQARPDGDGWNVTILYLEGTSTLEDLRSMFNKQ